MADDRLPSSKQSWKGRAKEAPRQEGPTHKWSERGLRPVPERKADRTFNFRVAGAIAGAVACLIFLIVLVWMLQPPPAAAVVLAGAAYVDNLAVPPNVLGWKGLEGIQEVSTTAPPWAFLPRASLHLLKGGIQPIDYREDWDTLIDSLEKSGFREETILFVVALHGGSDSQGAYLIPNKMTEPEQRLELSQVIESMGRLPKAKRKVLVLEGAQVPAEWRLGMLHNDFPQRLSELDSAIRAIPNLWVLSGCDIDQRCWSSEGLGSTALSHFIIKALRDETQAAGSDRRLTLDDLYRYVHDNVRNWAWNSRAPSRNRCSCPMVIPPTPSGNRRRPRGRTSSGRCTWPWSGRHECRSRSPS